MPDTSTISDYVAANGRFGLGDEGAHVELTQQALVLDGAELAIDGDFGPITESSVKAFQAREKLAVVGYVGPKTAAALDAVIAGVGEVPRPPTLPSAVPPWLSAMRAITGTKEVPGAKNSPIIMSWSGDIARAWPEMAKYSRTYTADAIPWCGLTVAYVMTVAKRRPVDEYLWAANWSQWGKALPKPVRGCVLTFKREGGNHVALHDGDEGSYMLVRGGNQSDMVNVSKRQRGSQTSARWPEGYPLP